LIAPRGTAVSISAMTRIEALPPSRAGTSEAAPSAATTALNHGVTSRGPIRTTTAETAT
jgi:hypothetical protein